MGNAGSLKGIKVREGAQLTGKEVCVLMDAIKVYLAVLTANVVAQFRVTKLYREMVRLSLARTLPTVPIDWLLVSIHTNH